jgi:hypothetical protein
MVPIDGQDVELEFLTNNLDWQPSDFLGNSLNAVQWQLWMALLVYVLLKYLAYVILIANRKFLAFLGA